jgi:uncharacterized protein (TIGR00369 family)
MTSSPIPSPESGIPAGFKPLTGGPDDMFVGINGPLYRKRDGDAFVLGMRVERRHCNPAHICHGGMLLTFVDMAMVLSASYQGKLGYFLPTINLSADFLASVPEGAWIEARTELLRVTRKMVFAQCMVRAGGAPVVRASGVFKIGAEFKRPAEEDPGARA